MAPVMMDVLEEHLDEAEFLWSRRERTLVSGIHELADVVELEERLLAHVEGLVVGGDAALNMLLLPALEADESERISAAALALLSGGGKRELEAMLAVLDSGDEAPRAAIGRAMALSEQPELAAVLLKRLTADFASPCAVAFDVLASRGALPQETRTEWLYRDAAEPVIAALRAPGPLPRAIAQTLLPRLVVDPRPGVREAAIMVGLISGAPAAWMACLKVAEEGGTGRRECLVALALGGEARDAEWLASLLPHASLRADVLWALGFSGQALAAEACLDWMGDDTLSVLAGEAFSAITGLRLEGEYRAAPSEESETLVPLEEDLEANLVPGPEASLPLPIQEAVAAWWRTARRDFAPGVRHLRGKTVDAGGLVEALLREPMRRRPMLALELAIRSRGAHILHPRALTHRQLTGLGAAHAGRAKVSMSSFAKLFGT